MANRIEIISKIPDTRAQVKKDRFDSNGFTGKISDVELVDVYTIDANLNNDELDSISTMLSNPITQNYSINTSYSQINFNWAIEIGFLPGVTDNVASTTKEGIEDLLKKQLNPEENVYTSQINFIKGDLTREEVNELAKSIANPLIQRIHIKSYDEFTKFNGMDVVVPKVKLDQKPTVDIVDILNASDDNLTIIGKQGISNSNGSRRGPLALNLTYMKTIQNYFATKKKRNPTDIELESIAQTWSEHCKHPKFADPIDDIKDGLYRTYIKGATNLIRKNKGKDDFCISVFTDNSGAIIFDDNYLVTDKAETHNSPSALDPFGGSITGIVGVNRDAIGFGLGAKPIINRYGFCFADPNDKTPIYKGKDFTQKMLSPQQIMDGVINGVNVGGNCSGIPTPNGFVYFDDRYKGKPLVFVGTVGLIPRTSAGRDSCEKEAQAGDYIVMVGGRVGKDGIHGATFSSEAMDSGSPATAVQIGDPITQKKLSDAIVKEARDLGLYTSITDDGAGGLSCSVSEMAKECGGCHVNLDLVPLKYPGLEPYEISISESQERMTLSVPKNKWNEFSNLTKRRGVEATIIGEFTNSGKSVWEYDGKVVMDIDMDFLHDGLPKTQLTTNYIKPVHEEPDFPLIENLTESLFRMLKRLNIASTEFISQQYDHEVQGGSVIKPLQGRGKINGDAAVVRPVLDSKKGVVISSGINPSYSDIDTYHMAACAIDTAIRNAVCVGASLDKIALLDNFCWCSSDEPQRLGELKSAVKACYDYSVAYGTPFISGKDSMFNDFKGFDELGNPIKISILPTLLISSIAVMDDSTKAVSLDAKMSGDLVYILGETFEELGGSEYFAMQGELLQGKKFIGNNVPRVDCERNIKLYNSLSKAIDVGIIASAQSVGKGGLAIALAKTAMGGMLGMDVSLENLPGRVDRDDHALYSESQGRIVVTVAPEFKDEFECLMNQYNNKKNENNNEHKDDSTSQITYAQIGKVTNDNTLKIIGRNNNKIVDMDIFWLMNSYKSTFTRF